MIHIKIFKNTVYLTILIIKNIMSVYINKKFVNILLITVV